VTYHFGTLDALVHAALQRASRAALEGARVESDSDRAADFAGDLPRLAHDDPDAQVLQFELALESRRRPELRPEIEAQYDEFFAVTERALARMGVDASPALARLVFAALDGLMLQQLLLERPEDGDAVLAELQRVLRLLGAR
jgi:AcrR family transcriptional regulator